MAKRTRKSDFSQWRSVATKLAKYDCEAIKNDDSTKSLADILAETGAIKGKKKQPKPKGRKDLRKEKRGQIKTNQNIFWMKKRGIIPEETDKKTQGKDAEKKKKKKKKKKPKAKVEKEEELSQDQIVKEALLAANETEDKIIARMEKKLGLSKKKKLPSSFFDDGLGYLLELCEPMDNVSPFMQDDEALESDGNQSEDEPEAKSSKKNRINKQDHQVEKKGKKEQLPKDAAESDGNMDEDLAMDDSDMEDDVSFGSEDDEELIGEDSGDDDIGSDEENLVKDDEEAASVEDAKEHKAELKKAEKSNENTVAKNEENVKYVPPQLRKTANEGNTEEKRALERLRKQLKGLINRLSESNLSGISQEIEALYLKYSRNDTNTILAKLVFDACIMPTHMPEKMLVEHVMLVAILHAHVGNEVGAFFVQELAEKFEELHSDVDKYANSKECDNVLVMIAQLYNFKVIDSLLVYDLIRELVTAFTERDIEMLLLALKSAGAEIRRDDPGSLKEIILEVQAKAASCSDLTKQARVRFMLEVITALRNNNLRKIPQYDPSVVDHARKVVKGIVRNESMGDMHLRISLKDLLQAKKKGRWWIVGSAWTGRDDDDDSTSKTSITKEDSQLLKIAKQQRMNTEIRKKIFCVLMTSEDYLDCFEKLLRLNLKEKQSREIVHVLIDCCLQEKSYNPYYSFLAQKLCEFSRANQVTFQYSFWDRFKNMSILTAQSSENMSRFLAHLLASTALSLSILKVVGFATMDKASINFFVQLFTILMKNYPENTVKSAFARIANFPKLALLREGLKIFLRHFLLPKKNSDTHRTETKDMRIQELVELAEAALDGREVSKF